MVQFCGTKALFYWTISFPETDGITTKSLGFFGFNSQIWWRLWIVKWIKWFNSMETRDCFIEPFFPETYRNSTKNSLCDFFFSLFHIALTFNDEMDGMVRFYGTKELFYWTIFSTYIQKVQCFFFVILHRSDYFFDFHSQIWSHWMAKWLKWFNYLKTRNHFMFLTSIFLKLF